MFSVPLARWHFYSCSLTSTPLHFTLLPSPGADGLAFEDFAGALRAAHAARLAEAPADTEGAEAAVVVDYESMEVLWATRSPGGPVTVPVQLRLPRAGLRGPIPLFQRLQPNPSLSNSALPTLSPRCPPPVVVIAVVACGGVASAARRAPRPLPGARHRPATPRPSAGRRRAALFRRARAPRGA